MVKTNAMRLLESAGIKYTTKTYKVDESDLRGIHIAQQIGISPEQIFKTLVVNGDKTGPIVFCIPITSELDLKYAASVSKNKSLEMVAVKDLLNVTGYIRGGCSPVGMKKKYRTYIDVTALGYSKISVSAGSRGCQVIVDPLQLISYLDAVTFDNEHLG